MCTDCEGPWPDAGSPDDETISRPPWLYEVVTANSDVRRRLLPAWWSNSVEVVGERDMVKEDEQERVVKAL